MRARAPTLLELQCAVRRDMLGLADGDSSAYVVPDSLPPRARLGIYRNTATGALLTALRLSYPAIRSLVGPEFFEGATRRFIEHCPPPSAWLDAYGATFPDFLARMPESASLAYLPDAARFEWAVNVVLHAPDAKPLDLGRLAELEPAELGHIRFAPHPAVQLIQSAFPVDAIWRAVLTRDDSALAAINLAEGPVWLCVRRTTSAVAIDRLAEGQWHFTAALLAGRPLHAALDEATDAAAHVWLATLLASGYFTEANLEGQVFNLPSGDPAT